MPPEATVPPASTDAPDPAAVPPAATEPAAAPVADEPLGEPGKRALDAERAAHKEAKRQLREMETQLEEARLAQMSEQEKAVAEARKAGESDATARVQTRLFAAETKVAAAGKLADPSLLADPDVAVKLLGLAQIPVTSDGDIDSEAISQAIDQMLLVRPYLAASNGATPTPSGSADGGAQGPAHMGSSAGQLTRDDLSSMSAEQIAKAKADGRLNVLLGIS